MAPTCHQIQVPDRFFYNPSNPIKVTYGLEILRSLGPKVWDMLPIDLKNNPSLAVFKTKIKKLIPHNCPCPCPCPCPMCAPTRAFLIYLVDFRDSIYYRFYLL